MTPGEEFVARLEARGFDFFTGVPCSLIAQVLAALERGVRGVYVEAVREDEAVAQAAGAYMAGRKPVVLMQNSGLGNSLNAIVSLNQIYRQPFLMVVTWRGFEGKDAPEHLVMGEAMPAILDAIRLPWEVYAQERIDGALDRVDAHFAARRPCALVIPPGVFEGHA